MICPECEKGMLQVKDKTVQRFLKSIPCPRCNGSGIAYCCDGEDVSQPDIGAGDTTSTEEAEALVA